MPDDRRSSRVLLVEDEPANRALVRAILARTHTPVLDGIELLEASSLREARLLLAAGGVDVVLLDVRLTDGSGLDLVPEIDALPPGIRPAIVIMSASVLPHEQNLALHSGADAFLGKPYRPSDVVETLNRFVGSRVEGAASR